MSYKTPNVYVEEQAILPPSVAEVSTAIPAFIGYTARAGANNELKEKAVRISSLLAYQRHFGEAPLTHFDVNVNNQNVVEVNPKKTGDYFMYDCLRLYFANGGGDCYIVSVGNHQEEISKIAIEKGIDALEKEDEPTLIVMTESANLSTEDYGALCQKVLMHCATLKDRFAIFDAGENDIDQVKTFREKIGTDNLKYGAAYFPYLTTNLGYHYSDDSVEVTGISDPRTQIGRYSSGDNGLLVTYTGNQSDAPKIKISKHTDAEEKSISVVPNNSFVLEITIPKTGASAKDIVAIWNGLSDKKQFNMENQGTGADLIAQEITSPQALTYASDTPSATREKLSKLKSNKTALYNQIRAKIDNERLTLPPSAAIAGVYARIDRERGVWKSPANVSLVDVIGPTLKITDQQQEDLNVDATAGKSINAIRSFTGKGTIVWGARTLAGNDNEWRYISVRRLFNLIEESLQKSTAFAVFEPNNAMTWLKVRTLAQSYLDDLWRKGALAGATPEEAYFVKADRGQTMTEQDILEGKLIVEIGVAAVRPAEFIVLRFAHKLQQA